uniref:Uncharacterized protein n=1 Tax=Rhizophora mucronata TaxID=61149 RepID=A0A2P2JFA5_RHIMU
MCQGNSRCTRLSQANNYGTGIVAIDCHETLGLNLKKVKWPRVEFIFRLKSQIIMV